MRFWLFLFITFLACIPMSQAHFAERYGYGVTGSASAKAVAGRCETNSHAAYYNPALLACNDQINLEFSFVHAQDNFKNISDVTTSSTEYPTNYTSPGSISTDYPNHQAIQLGAQIPLLHQFDFLKQRHAKIGFSFHYNLDHMISNNSDFAFSPSYSLYESRDRRVYVALSTALDIIKNRLSLGLGAQMFISAGVSTVVLYNSTNQGNKAAMNIDPEIGAILALRYHPILSWPLFVNLVYHQGISQRIRLDAQSNFDVAGTSVPFEFSASHFLYSEPHQIRFGLSWEEKTWSVESNVVFAAWQEMQNARPQIQFVAPAPDSIQMENRFKNQIFVHQGGSYHIAPFSFFLGFSYEPSIVDTMNWKENEIDADKVVIGLGTFYDFPYIKGCRIGFSYQLQHLFSQDVTKDQSSFLGSPGYSIGGQVHQVQIGMNVKW